MHTDTTEDRPVFFVGIDLAIRANHVLAILDQQGRRVGRNIRFGHGFDEHQRMYQAVNERLPDGADILWAAEPTGGVWMPSAAFLNARGDTLLLQKPTKVADLRRYEKRHLKTDPIDAKTIAETTRLDHQRGLAASPPPDPKLQAQRALARRIEALKKNLGAAKNRLTSILCHTLLPDLAVTGHDWAASSMLKVLHPFADLRTIAARSENAFIDSARGPTKGGSRTSRQALAALHQAARDSREMYGADGIDWATHACLLQETIQTIWEIQARIATLEQHLEGMISEDCPPETRQAARTAPGVGKHCLEQLLAFFGPPEQWTRFEGLKQYGGLVPILEATGASESALVMSKMGEPIIRKLVYQMGNTARQFDAEFAACYHHQMVNKGKRHTGACIATGLRVLNVLRAILRNPRPYQPRDPQTGETISRQRSRELAITTYRVPEEIRKERRKRKHSDDAASAGKVKDVPKALPEPHRNQAPSLC